MGVGPTRLACSSGPWRDLKHGPQAGGSKLVDSGGGHCSLLLFGGLRLPGGADGDVLQVCEVEGEQRHAGRV